MTTDQAYKSYPRLFLRHVFRAGLHVALRWEGRARTAARRAQEARERAVYMRTRAKEMGSRAREVGRDVGVRARAVGGVMKGRFDKMREQGRSRKDKGRENVEAKKGLGLVVGDLGKQVERDKENGLWRRETNVNVRESASTKQERERIERPTNDSVSERRESRTANTESLYKEEDEEDMAKRKQAHTR